MSPTTCRSYWKTLKRCTAIASCSGLSTVPLVLETRSASSAPTEAARRRSSASLPGMMMSTAEPVSYTHLRAHETRHDLVCRLLLEKKKKNKPKNKQRYV